jgi:cell division protein FtsI (penicillin-binding protein 3)
VDIKKDILWRVYLGFLGLMAFCIFIFAKAVYIQTAEGPRLKAKTDSLNTKIDTVESERGTIYTEAGEMLSTSMPIYDIRIDFEADGLRKNNGELFTKHADSLSLMLNKLFGDKTVAEYKKELTDGYKKSNRYYLLKKNITFSDWKRMQTFPLVNLGRNKSGIIPIEKSKRLNPYRVLAFRTIGLVKADSNFNVGLERYYDNYLRGKIGTRVLKRVAGNTYVPIEGVEVEPDPGKDVYTTLDITMQEIVENALYNKLKEQMALSGCAIIMEVQTGKIKAIANLGLQKDGSYWEDLNYAIQPFEPGSTIKLASLLALLHDGFVNLNTEVNIYGGSYNFGTGATMVDSKQDGTYMTNVLKVFENSSNVGISLLANKNYKEKPEKLLNHFKRFHLNEKSGIDLIGEGKPQLPNPKASTWSGTSIPWMSVGYEMRVNPMQILMLYNAVANNGKLMQPYLVNEIKSFGITEKKFNPIVLENNIASKEALQAAKQALIGVVQNGTAKSIQSTKYTIAGKTGTALIADRNTSYADQQYYSSFAGFFPAENPQYTCIIVVKNKRNATQVYGADVAAPVFKEIADRIFSLKTKTIPNIQWTDTNLLSAHLSSKDANYFAQLYALPQQAAQHNGWAIWQQKNKQINITEQQIAKNTMPNMLGLAAKDAVFIAENLGLQIQMYGRGKVISQSIVSGAAIYRNQKLIIQLK